MQPAIAPDGTLTYTPAPLLYGVATVTVQVHDSGAATSVGQTFTITVTPLVTTQLVITTSPPANVAVGAPFDLIVTAQDGAGRVATAFNAPVTVVLVSDPGGATLGGTLTATASRGVATFTGLTLNKAGSNYILQLRSGDFLVTTGSIATPGAATPASHQFFSTAEKQVFLDLSITYALRCAADGDRHADDRPRGAEAPDQSACRLLLGPVADLRRDRQRPARRRLLQRRPAPGRHGAPDQRRR